MKKFLFTLFIIEAITVLTCVAFGQATAPAASPAAVVAAASAAPTGLVGFITAYKAVISGVVVAILDLIFAINPNAASNGLLHWVLVQAKVVSGEQS